MVEPIDSFNILRIANSLTLIALLEHKKTLPLPSYVSKNTEIIDRAIRNLLMEIIGIEKRRLENE